MDIEVLIKLFERDIIRLEKELDAFHDEKNIWETLPGISNSSGNLALHLAGNLNHFIGASIGETGYVRQREAEFSSKDVPRKDLIKTLEATRLVVATSLRKMTPAHLNLNYPDEVFGYSMTYGYFLTHLVSHLSYHLGQINYLRRALEGE